MNQEEKELLISKFSDSILEMRLIDLNRLIEMNQNTTELFETFKKRCLLGKNQLLIREEKLTDIKIKDKESYYDLIIENICLFLEIPNVEKLELLIKLAGMNKYSIEQAINNFIIQADISLGYRIEKLFKIIFTLGEEIEKTFLFRFLIMKGELTDVYFPFIEQRIFKLEKTTDNKSPYSFFVQLQDIKKDSGLSEEIYAKGVSILEKNIKKIDIIYNK